MPLGYLVSGCDEIGFFLGGDKVFVSTEIYFDDSVVVAWVG